MSVFKKSRQIKLIVFCLAIFWSSVLYSQKVKQASKDLASKPIHHLSKDQAEVSPNSISGSEMSFSQISENEFEISLVKYFYCMADMIDSIETVSIYESLATMMTSQPQLHLNSIKDSTLIVNANCPNFKKLCVKKATYIGRLKLMMPMIGGYDVTWGHCCWNENSIRNIEGLLESKKQGLGLVLHIPQIGIAESNSSPVFQSLPILSACKGQLLSISNTAYDKDNDSLSYEFSQLFDYKAGNDIKYKDEPMVEPGKPMNKSFAGPRPPFKKIVYRKEFTPSNPVKSKLISINYKNGEMQLKPDTIGEFLLGISVNEFRNSKQLGAYQRVYKIKVTD